MPQRKEWFGEWFDSQYYHILYHDRDHREAQGFMDNLIKVLGLSDRDAILDVACGKGRHSIYLNEKGFDVTGFDLSEQNVAYAKEFENEKLHFFVHDMREPFKPGKFDVVVNLFTSFGYFNTEEENITAIKAIASSLKNDGKFLLDFLNPYTVIHALKPIETKSIKGINFKIRKYLSQDNFIIKEIEFNDNGNSYHYEERVRAIRRIDFLSYFREAGLLLENIYGDYHFNSYVAEDSERMIFVLKK
ncbi:MAG: class I SAM-dependent methyltransferase [Bacteroidota bacterium]